jgi:alginate O-acetyltransferase complex protein AlgJ
MLAPDKLEKIYCSVLVAVFLALISLPLLGFILPLPASQNLDEKRPLYPAPRWEWSKAMFLFEEFDAYFQDHFGFRSFFIRAHSLFTAKLFYVSPNKRVVVGKSGWLFLGSDVHLSFLARPLTSAELMQKQNDIERIHAQLAAQNIRYLLAVVPSRCSVYPEYLPDWTKKIKRQSRLDQFVQHMRTNSAVPVLDLRQSIFEFKATERVYHKTDSHWNENGAFAACRQIADQISIWFPGVRPLRSSDFQMRVLNREGGDLATAMGLRDVLQEEWVYLDPVNPLPFRVIQRTPSGIPLLTRHEDASLPVAVVFHDSFSYHGFDRLMARHFSKTRFISVVDPQQVFNLMGTEISPDTQVVIHELVETHLFAN